MTASSRALGHLRFNPRDSLEKRLGDPDKDPDPQIDWCRGYASQDWLKLKKRAMEQGSVPKLRSLVKCVQRGTEQVQERNIYFTESGQCVDISLYRQPQPVAYWLSSSNANWVPEGGEGELSPPLIVTTKYPLDIALELAQAKSKPRVVLCVEVTEFNDEGGMLPLKSYGETSAQQHCILRTDLHEYCKHAQTHMLGASSVQSQMTASEDPWVLGCEGVILFRGSAQEGYPFLEKPVQIDCVLSAMSSQRPLVRVAKGLKEGGLNRQGQEWYAEEVHHAALLDRLQLTLSAVSLLSGICKPQGDRRTIAPLAPMKMPSLTETDHDEDEEPTTTLLPPRADRPIGTGRPILVMTVPGCYERGKHPRDAVALSLKHMRQEYASHFHAIIVSCGPDLELAKMIDFQANGDNYTAASLAPMEWDKDLLTLSVNPELQECRNSNGSTPELVGELPMMRPGNRVSMFQKRQITDEINDQKRASVAAVQRRTSMMQGALNDIKDMRKKEHWSVKNEVKKPKEKSIDRDLQLRKDLRERPKAKPGSKNNYSEDDEEGSADEVQQFHEVHDLALKVQQMLAHRANQAAAGLHDHMLSTPSSPAGAAHIVLPKPSQKTLSAH